MWAGLLADGIIGPYLLSERLNEATYQASTDEELAALLEHVPLATGEHM
jgi:hypothetical protein